MSSDVSERVWAVLCTACADQIGSDPGSDTRQTLLVMLNSNLSDMLMTLTTELQSRGWANIEVERVKALTKPFRSDDPVICDCYKAAAANGFALIIY